MLLRTSSSGEEMELFVFLEEELGMEAPSLGAPLHEEMTAQQRGRLYEWLLRSFDVVAPSNTRETTFFDVVELMQKRPRRPDPVPVVAPVPPVVPAAPVAGAATVAAAPRAASPKLAGPWAAVRVLSYNVNYAFCRRGAIAGPEQTVAAAMRAARADVMLLQETHAAWRAHLSSCGFDALFPHRWAHDDDEASGGLAVYSRFPLLFSQLLETPLLEQGSWFPAALHVLLLPGGPVAVANVHLRPALEDDGSATMFTMGTTSSIRKREMARLLEIAPDGMPLVVAGDFNENDEHSACELLRGLGMHDALALTAAHTHWWVLRGAGVRIVLVVVVVFLLTLVLVCVSEEAAGSSFCDAGAGVAVVRGAAGLRGQRQRPSAGAGGAAAAARRLRSVGSVGRHAGQDGAGPHAGRGRASRPPRPHRDPGGAASVKERLVMQSLNSICNCVSSQVEVLLGLVEQRVEVGVVVHKDKGGHVPLVAQRGGHLNHRRAVAAGRNHARVAVALLNVQLSRRKHYAHTNTSLFVAHLVANGGTHPHLLHKRHNGEHEEGPLQQTRNGRAHARRLLAQHVAKEDR
jgi:endonuclease/exonuclease/phosphatase family metal-dependent hydrolase